MPVDYVESVLDAADANGCLDIDDACRLCAQHGETLGAFCAATGSDSLNAETGLREFNAELMLQWLGY